MRTAEGDAATSPSALAAAKRAPLRDLRGGLVAMAIQEPMTALDPVYTMGQQIGETVRRHLRRLPQGCSFAPRCARRTADCRLAVPEPRFPEPGRMAACLAVAGPVAALG